MELFILSTVFFLVFGAEVLVSCSAAYFSGAANTVESAKLNVNVCCRDHNKKAKRKKEKSVPLRVGGIKSMEVPTVFDSVLRSIVVVVGVVGVFTWRTVLWVASRYYILFVL